MHILSYLPIVATVAFSSFVNAQPIEARDACSDFSHRTFRISTSTTNRPFGALVYRYLASIEYDFDNRRRIAGPEISSCYGGKGGKGCKWQREEESQLDSYKLDHFAFYQYSALDAEIKISGEGCDDQVLQCKGEVGNHPVRSLASPDSH